MRDRTFIGESGRRIPGSEVVGPLWERGLADSLGDGRDENLRIARARGRGRARRASPAATRSSRASTRSGVTTPGHRRRGDAREVRRLLRAPAAPALGRGLRVPADPGRARAGRARGLARHRVRLGGRAPLPRGVLALQRPRGVPRRGVAAHEEHPPRPRHRADAAAVQPPGPRRRADLDARPRLRRAGRLRHRRVVLGSRARRLPRRPDREARDVGGGAARRAALHDRGARSPGTTGSSSRMPPRNVVPKPRQKPHPPVWVACSRRDTIHLAAQKAIGALAFAFVDPEEARHWVDDYYATLATEGVPDRRRGQRATSRASRRSCATTTKTPRSRAASRARTSSATRSRTTTCSAGTRPGTTDVWAEYQERRAEHGFDPERVHGRGGERRPPRREGGAGRARRAARRGRHARPGPRVPAALRGVRRRPGDLLLAGGQEPPRAHHGEPRAVRARGAPRVQGPRREGDARQGAAARAGHRAGDGAQARLGPPAASDRGLRRSRRSRGRSPTASGSDDFHAWLDKFAEESATGESSEFQNLLG